jgi:ABC-type sugar transport system substrate-binding protein
MVYYKQLFQLETKKHPNCEIVRHDTGFGYKAMTDGLECFISQGVDLIMYFPIDIKQMLETALEVVAKQSGKGDIAKFQAAASDILAEYPMIDGFCVSDDWMGGRIVRALREKGYNPGQVKIAACEGSKTGINDSKDGWYLGLVDQGPSLRAKQDISIMRALLADKVRIPAFAAVAQEVITKENIGMFAGNR